MADRDPHADEAALLRQLVDHVPGMLAYWDREQRCRFANAAYDKWFGWDPSTLIGRSMQELLGPIYEKNRPYIEGALRGEPQTFDREIPDPRGGPPRYSQADYIPDVGPDGEVRGFFVLVSDITARRRLENELVELREAVAEERARRTFVEVIEELPLAKLVLDDDTVIRFANRAAGTLFGYSVEELRGMPSERLVPERLRAGRTERMRLDAQEGPKVYETRALRKDGNELPVEVRLARVTIGGEQLLVGAVLDITDRERLAARFRIASESSPAAMVMVDDQGKILMANQQCVAMFGYGLNELLGRPVELLVPEAQRAAHPAHRAAFHTGPGPRQRRMAERGELFAQRKNGEVFPVEVGLNPVDADEGRAVLAAIVDITERWRARQNLEKANEALVRSNLDLQRVAYIASHDLQTPLRSIATFLDLVKSEYGARIDERGRSFIDRAINASLNLRELIQGLLAYSRIDTQVTPFTRFSLRAPIDRALELLHAALVETGATVRVADDLPEVRGDLAQLAQLFQNLVGNALKYRGTTPPEVRISALQQEGQVVFMVEDNGLGIAPKYHEQIFEIFKRLHDAKSYPGNGIGLAVCRRIVGRHGGRLWVESDGPGHGSRFLFTLPGAVS